ncbi:MAG: TldD/PmbA family protein, partial [Alphaproteobacteria bacterium]
MPDQTLMTRASALVDRLLAAGADAADVLVVNGTSLDVQVRMGEVEEVEQSEAQDVGLRAMIKTDDGFAQATVSSTELDGPAMDDMIARVVAMARLAPPDPYVDLAKPDELATNIANLDLADSTRLDAAALSDRARECENTARHTPGITNSEGAASGYGSAEIALATSNGFAGTYFSSSHSVSCSVLAGEGLNMERDYAYRTARHLDDLMSPQEIGAEAASRTLRRLGAVKPASGTCPVVFDPRVSGSIAGHMASALNGASIARKSSFLVDKMGKQIAHSDITLLDDPKRVRGLASRPFDGEGVATQPLNLIENGVVKHWLLDTATARQLGLKSNGRARRGVGSSPSPGPANLSIAPGTLTPAALIGEIEDGIYITEMIGSAVSLITGDYSRGASGFRIKSGELAEPVSEFTIAGNLKDMFMALTAADDLVFDYAT